MDGKKALRTPGVGDRGLQLTGRRQPHLLLHIDTILNSKLNSAVDRVLCRSWAQFYAASAALQVPPAMAGRACCGNVYAGRPLAAEVAVSGVPSHVASCPDIPRAGPRRAVQRMETGVPVVHSGLAAHWPWPVVLRIALVSHWGRPSWRAENLIVSGSSLPRRLLSL